MLNNGRFRQHVEGLHDLKYIVPGNKFQEFYNLSTPDQIVFLEEIDSKVDSLYRPDPHDPDFYCLECEKIYPSKLDYFNHMKDYHNLKFKHDKSESISTQHFISQMIYQAIVSFIQE